MESEAVKSEKEQYELLRRHIRQIKNNPLWSKSHVIFIPENNLGLEASHMASMVENFTGLTTFEQKDGVPGVCLTGAIKRMYQVNMVDCLFEGSLRFDRDFFTVSKKKSERVTPDSMLSLCREQMERFHWEHKESNDAHGKDRWSMTGKLGEKQDDALLALLMAYTWGTTIQTNLRYRTWLDTFNGSARGVVTEVAKAVMRPLKRRRLAETHTHDATKHLMGTTKRMRGDPNTQTEMTGDLARGTQKRMKLKPLV